MNPNTARSWVPFPLVLPFLHFLKLVDPAASTFCSPHNMMIWYEITWNYRYIWLCYKTYVDIYLWSIYIHTYVWKNNAVIYASQQKINVFFPHPPALNGCRWQDISWWITWISSSATMREGPGGYGNGPGQQKTHMLHMECLLYVKTINGKAIHCRFLYTSEIGLPRLDIPELSLFNF